MVSRIAALLALAVVVLAGCGRQQSAPPKEDKIIRIVRNLGGREGFKKHWELWKKTFEDANPGWTMELIDLGDNDAAGYYKTRIATDDLPEIVQTWALVKFLVDGGYVQPFPDRYFETFGVKRPASYKGKWYTSQSGLQIQGVAVNKNMWADIGVTEPPATWDEFIAGLRKLKAKGYQPLVYGGREWSAYWPLMCAMSMDLYEHQPDASKPSWTKRRDAGEIKFASDPTMKLIMKNLVALLDEFTGKGVLSDGYADEGRQFYGGKAATWIMGCWIGGELEPNKADIDIAYWPLPSMTGRPPAFMTNDRSQNGWAISSKVKGEKLEKCAAVFDAFLDTPVYQIFLNGEVQFGEASKVPVTGPKSDWPPAQRLFDDMKANLDRYGTIPGWYLGTDDLPPQALNWPRVMQEILSGNKDVDKLLQILDDEWDRARKGE